MEHPHYSPDLALCNFFLFGALKQAFPVQHFNAMADLFMAGEAFLGKLSVDCLQTVFQEWVRRL
jgi:hypothetical protein